MMSNASPTRRTFVKQIAVAGLTMPLVSPRLIRAASPNSVVRHVCIGAGGMAFNDLHQFMSHPHVRIVGVCDVDASHLATAMGKTKLDAKTFSDWRRIFDDFAGEFDSCNVTIPDHMHAPVAMRALEAGKHLYCQKPMTKWFNELTALRDKAHATPVVTQLGIQNHARTEFRLARWAIEEGLIGKVREIHAWSNKTWGGPRALPTPVTPPATLDWNSWLGVAPHRPFAPNVYHPDQWRDWVDFGTGLLGDMACHVLDSPVSALGLGSPRRITSTGPAPTEQNWPDRTTVRFEYAGNERTAGDTLTLTWYDGASTAPKEITDRFPFRLPQTGSMTIGEKGAMMLPHVAAPRLLPAEKFADVKFPKLDPIDHYHKFIDAVRGEAATEAPLDGYGGHLVESVLIGTIAQRLPNTTLRYDGATRQFADDAVPAELMSRADRAW
ncbi:MAG: gfo/Idh/MocA family oxidoreductase [Planctomycetes bacterium]|nr:gfo/Idh/MocA family oxidoreductase [Planctomycetota bacterium]